MCKSSYCSVVCPNLRCGPIWISPLLGTSRRHRYIFPLSQILSFLILRLLDMASLRCMAPGTFAPQILILQLFAMVWWICAHDLISCMEVCDEKKGKWNDLKYGSMKTWKIWKIWRELRMPSSVTSNCRESRFKSSETVRDDKWPTNVEKWFEFTPLW